MARSASPVLCFVSNARSASSSPSTHAPIPPRSCPVARRSLALLSSQHSTKLSPQHSRSVPPLACRLESSPAQHPSLLADSDWIVLPSSLL
ncbi:hypothetical protein ACFX12_030037 [Malus domestica]